MRRGATEEKEEEGRDVTQQQELRTEMWGIRKIIPRRLPKTYNLIHNMILVKHMQCFNR